MNCLPVVNGQAESEGKQRGGEKYKESSRSPFAKHFSERLYELRELLRRHDWISRHLNNDADDGAWAQDLEVYERYIIVLLRAICCENPKLLKKNYTIQSFIERQFAGQQGDVLYISEILDAPVFQDVAGVEHNLRDTIKIVADRYLCHMDNFEPYNLNGEIGLPKTWTADNINEMIRILFAGGDGAPVRRLIKAMGMVFARISIAGSIVEPVA